MNRAPLLCATAPGTAFVWMNIQRINGMVLRSRRIGRTLEMCRERRKRTDSMTKKITRKSATKPKRKSRSLALGTCSALDADICEKLRAHCKGHPHAKVAWPHRVLHEAREEIERLRSAIEWALGMGKDGFRPRMEGEGAYWWRTELRRRALPNAEICNAPTGAERKHAI